MVHSIFQRYFKIIWPLETRVEYVLHKRCMFCLHTPVFKLYKCTGILHVENQYLNLCMSISMCILSPISHLTYVEYVHYTNNSIEVVDTPVV